MFAAFTFQSNAALADARELIPMGQAAGISLSTEGVVVVGLSTVTNSDGTYSPAKDAGILEGDVIIAVGDKKIESAADLTACVEKAGDCVSIHVRRGGEELCIDLTPARSEDGKARIGVWIRENMLGIGTITFYDPATGIYGALGHGINEKSSGKLVFIQGGELLHSEIESVKRGESGTPGELQGSYEPGNPIGSVLENTSSGVFGKLNTAPRGQSLPIAGADTVQLGKATILTCVDGSEPQEYEIRIKALYRGGEAGNRDMLIEVTDKALIEKTGGIVQGMSGSPILQNGRIVGAVTHVLVGDPKKGYGILIENMLDAYGAQTMAA
jgi:stage IV sporulation protein B